LNPGPCIYYVLSLSTELSSQGLTIFVMRARERIKFIENRKCEKNRNLLTD